MVVKPGDEIPFFNITRQVKVLREELETTCAEVFAGGSFILGEWVEKFEGQVADFVDAKYAVGVACGTDALALAYQALGAGMGDGLITTPFTFFATSGVMFRLGIRPFFVDIDPATFNIDPNLIREFLERECRREDTGCIHVSTKTPVKGIAPVHLFGQMAPMDFIMDLARDYGLFVVEDAAQALGASQEKNGEKHMAGSIGSAAAFSFYPTKNLGAFGDAGLVSTNDRDTAEKISLLRAHGFETDGMVRLPGLCSRLDALQAALLSKKFGSLEKWNRRRADIAGKYRDMIGSKSWASEVVRPTEIAGNSHIWHQFALQVKFRDEIERHLKTHGVGSGVYYRVPIHLHPIAASLGYSKGDFPEAERAAEKVLALPIWPELTDDEIERVVNTLGLFYDKYRVIGDTENG